MLMSDDRKNKFVSTFIENKNPKISKNLKNMLCTQKSKNFSYSGMIQISMVNFFLKFYKF